MKIPLALLASFLLSNGFYLTVLPLAQRVPREPAVVQEIERGPRGLHELALTFDAGGEDAGFADLLEALGRVRCTFFLTGQWMQAHPDHVAALLRAGHELANHTWNHRDLTQLKDEEIRSEILRTGMALNAVAKPQTLHLWRAPYGARNARVLSIAHQLGYISIYWTFDSLDSVDPPKSSDYLIARITHLTDAKLSGAILLMHVGEPSTVLAVPAILSDLQRRGLVPVTVSVLLAGQKFHPG
ncbi:MAG: polysaccharide deacetylase family protein [Chthoniobacterales bacterium]